MESGKNAPLGWKFVPWDDELLWGFLYPMFLIIGEVWGECPIKFSDLVYKKPPWEFCTESTSLPGALPGDKKHYFFTELKNKDQSRKDRTVGSYWTWEESQRKKILRKEENNNNGIMGFKRLFKFKEKGAKNTTDWLMHEFSVLNREINFVLCVIQQKKEKEEMSSASAGGNRCPAPNDHLVSYWWDPAAAPLGWKFVPSDDELLWGFLYPVVLRGEVWCPFKFSDLVYRKPPWEFCTESTSLPGALPGDKKHYFVTVLKDKDQSRKVRTVGSYWTWEASQMKKILWKGENNNNEIMGFKRLFKFKEMGAKNTTDWLMHEFSLPDRKINFVLCVIQKKKEKEEMSSASAGGNRCPAPNDHPVSYWRDSAADLRDPVPDLPADDVSGFLNDSFISFPDAVLPGHPNYIIHNSNTSCKR